MLRVSIVVGLYFLSRVNDRSSVIYTERIERVSLRFDNLRLYRISSIERDKLYHYDLGRARNLRKRRRARKSRYRRDGIIIPSQSPINDNIGSAQPLICPF